MKIQKVIIKNWKNFLKAEINLHDRLFIVGPNAAGKSNLLDVFRFMRDIVKPGGGLQKAVEDRGGIEKVRCLHARKITDVSIAIFLKDGSDNLWEYILDFNLKTTYPKKLIIKKEYVKKNNEVILDRPNPDDKKDDDRLTQTYLEQVNSNKEFRIITEYFNKVQYLHLVPQLIRNADYFKTSVIPEDPFGQKFLEKIVKTPEKSRKSRLKKLETALNIIVPNLEKIELTNDEMGVPHLESIYTHWRKYGCRQREDQFSDGTLRIIGLLWTLLEANALLLLEEPELSLHDGVVAKLTPLIFRLQKESMQVIISTHSPALLSDKGIGVEEILLLIPGKEGVQAISAKDNNQIKSLMESGMIAGDVVIPFTKPPKNAEMETLI